MAVQTYKPLYSVKEVSKILMISINTVYSLMNQGRLPYLSLGSKKVRGSDLERFIETYPTEETERCQTKKLLLPEAEGQFF